MSRIVSAADLAASFAARYPGLASPGASLSLNASADPLPSVQAAGAVRGYAPPSGNLVYVKAKENFFASGDLIAVDDYVEVPENDARDLERREFAVIVTQAEVDAAKAASKTKVVA